MKKNPLQSLALIFARNHGLTLKQCQIDAKYLARAQLCQFEYYQILFLFCEIYFGRQGEWNLEEWQGRQGSFYNTVK